MRRDPGRTVGRDAQRTAPPADATPAPTEAHADRLHVSPEPIDTQPRDEQPTVPPNQEGNVPHPVDVADPSEGHGYGEGRPGPA